MFAEFLAFIPIVGLAACAEKKALGTSYLGLPVANLCAILYVYTIFLLRRFPCPRCGKNFLGKLGGPQVFLDRKCAYCGLKKYADS